MIGGAPICRVVPRGRAQRGNGRAPQPPSPAAPLNTEEQQLHRAGGRGGGLGQISGRKIPDDPLLLLRPHLLVADGLPGHGVLSLNFAPTHLSFFAGPRSFNEIRVRNPGPRFRSLPSDPCPRPLYRFTGLESGITLESERYNHICIFASGIMFHGGGQVWQLVASFLLSPKTCPQKG